MAIIFLTHTKTKAVIRVDSEQYNSDGKDGHGHSKKERDAAGWKPSTDQEVADELAAMVERTVNAASAKA